MIFFQLTIAYVLDGLFEILIGCTIRCALLANDFRGEKATRRIFSLKAGAARLRRGGYGSLCCRA